MTARHYFLKSPRIGFSQWTERDLPLARQLWGNEAVSRYICASGRFTEEEILSRLTLECSNQRQYSLQYWPIFSLEEGKLLGCCGLRPHGEDLSQLELGIHLLPQYWRQGYATEAAKAVIDHAFETLGTKELFAGHNPKNEASRQLLKKLGFAFIGEEFYAPTGLYHPSYILKKPTVR